MAEVKSTQALSFRARAERCSTQIGRRLFSLMGKKCTNLSVTIDVHQGALLLELAEAIAPYICILKTHIDLLTDFTPKIAQRLRKLSDQYNFLLFEDRKFADIGAIACEQYRAGLYCIADWAHITNAHILPGPHLIEALASIGKNKGNGLLLVAQMSSCDAKTGQGYAEKAVQMARLYPEFVMGFITQKRLTEEPGLFHITPGVKMGEGTDSLGQQYRSPEKAIIEQGNDIIIVGRGVYEAPDPVASADLYRKEAWAAYQKKIG